MYSKKDIQVLKWNEAVRKRPAMYLGSADNRGLITILKGAATNAYIRLLSNDFLIEIIDNLSLRITINEIKGKIRDDWAKDSGNFPNPFWVDLSTLNALSSVCVIDFIDEHDAILKQQQFEEGYLTKGTIDNIIFYPKKITATFQLDSTVWEEGFTINTEYLIEKIRKFACLRKKQRFDIRYNVGEEGCRVIYHFRRGLEERLMLETNYKFHYTNFDTYLDVELENCTLELAFAFNSYNAPFLKSYVNDYRTYHNGSHVKGLLNGLTKGIKRYLKKYDLKDYKVTNGLIAKKLIAILNVQLKTPNLIHSTKNELDNPEIIKPIDTLVSDTIFEAMEVDEGKTMDFLKSFKVREY